MATLYVVEYAKLAKEDYGDAIQAGEEPALAEYTIPIGSSSSAPIAFQKDTRFVMLHTDAICHIGIGGDQVVAKDSKRRLPADGTVFYGIRNGTNLSIAVKDGV